MEIPAILEVVLVKIAISVAKFIILVVLLLGLVAIAMYFSGYTMYAQVGENFIFDSGSGYKLSSTEPLRVDLGYTATGLLGAMAITDLLLVLLIRSISKSFSNAKMHFFHSIEMVCFSQKKSMENMQC